MITREDAVGLMPKLIDSAQSKYATDQNEALKRYLQGKEAESQEKLKREAMQQRSEDLALQRQNQANIANQNNQTRIQIAEMAKAMKQPQKSPFEQALETSAGRKLADYATGGGREGLQENINQLDTTVKSLKDRDAYDRIVGGATAFAGPLMGFLAPAEKQRRDAAWATANHLAKEQDSTPTREQVMAIMGQIYDPSQTNEVNKQKLSTYLTKLKGTQQAKEQALSNASMGLPSAAPAGVIKQSTPGMSAAEQELARRRALRKE